MSNINYYNEPIAKICKTLKTLRWPNYPGSFRNDLPKGGRFDTDSPTFLDCFVESVPIFGQNGLL